MIRTAEQLRAVLDANPFPGREGAKTAVLFLSGPCPANPLDGARGHNGEELHPGHRELYIWYPNGQGQSKLKLPPPLQAGTVRNMNTVGKLVEMAGGRRGLCIEKFFKPPQEFAILLVHSTSRASAF